MNDTQIILLLTAPMSSLVIVIAGYIVQNANLNARTGELRSEFNARLTTEIQAVRAELMAFRGEMRAELVAVRAEMAKNQSELLSALAQHEHRITKV